MRKIILICLTLLLFLTFSKNVWAKECNCATGSSGDAMVGSTCLESPPNQCGSGQLCDCGTDAVLINVETAAYGCSTGKALCISTSSPTTSPYRTVIGGCNICGCEQDVIVGTSYCPKCDISCQTCVVLKSAGGTFEKGGSWSAIGCIPTGDFNDFVVWFLQRAIGISGGIAFLLMISGGFKILISAGDPKGVQAGGETITSALTGLLFIIFSVFLLELIGVKILGIPGL